MEVSALSQINLFHFSFFSDERWEKRRRGKEGGWKGDGRETAGTLNV